MPHLLLVALLFILPASVANADECAKAESQRAMNACARKNYENSDGALNVLYRQITQRLNGDNKTMQRLISAQRAWVRFRDAECKFAKSGVSGGSIEALIFLGCANRLTRARIDDLRTYLKCQEGDLSCPVPPK
ncbi:MAG: hypothetical protein ACI89J_002861 [Hyphomicrobiaceae bacterium]|jgi:uncharacterized protein YecT (DUF1311 family)